MQPDPDFLTSLFKFPSSVVESNIRVLYSSLEKSVLKAIDFDQIDERTNSFCLCETPRKVAAASTLGSSESYTIWNRRRKSAGAARMAEKINSSLQQSQEAQATWPRS